MEADDGSSPTPRKVKFSPKAQPPRRTTSPVVRKTGVNNIGEDDEAARAQKLLKKFNENLRRTPKVQKSASVQVAFGAGATPSNSIRKFGINRSEGDSSGSGIQSGVNASVDEDNRIDISSSSTEEPVKIKKEYKEPWDYHFTNYPTTLPLRRPYSGNPEQLNEAEFGEAARKVAYDENTINSASDLGLLEESDKERMFLFQFPPKLPIAKSPASAKGKAKAENSKPSDKPGFNKLSSLKELPEGYVGKLLVYKSGAVKLKLGDALFDVSPGIECAFAQDVVAVNPEEKQCCAVGELGKRAIVTPDFDSVDLG